MLPNGTLSFGLPQDPALALQWLMKAVEAGRWYQKAIAWGDPDAMRNLGLLYAKGQEGFPKDEATALSWYRKAADLGEPDAMNRVGFFKQKASVVCARTRRRLYAGTRKPQKKAMPLPCSIGEERYLDGDGVQKDQAQALYWFRKVAS